MIANRWADRGSVFISPAVSRYIEQGRVMFCEESHLAAMAYHSRMRVRWPTPPIDSRC